MTHVVLVSNPNSGSADDDVLERVASTLRRLGEVVSVTPDSVDSFGDALEEPVRGAELLVVAGGDGTLNCTINGLGKKMADVQLALVPMGTGNDLARTLGLPLDPAAAAEVAVSGRLGSLDIGEARSSSAERLFVNACMGGFPVAVDEAIEGGIKERMGPLAFWIGGAKALADLTRYEVRVGDTSWSDLLAIGVGNGKTAGGGIQVFPGASVTDGRLDLCAMGAASLTEGLKLVSKVKEGEHADLPSVDLMSEGSFRVESDPPLEFNVDGELVNMLTPAEFSIVSAARIKTPA